MREWHRCLQKRHTWSCKEEGRSAQGTVLDNMDSGSCACKASILTTDVSSTMGSPFFSEANSRSCCQGCFPFCAVSHDLKCPLDIHLSETERRRRRRMQIKMIDSGSSHSTFRGRSASAFDWQCKLDVCGVSAKQWPPMVSGSPGCSWLDSLRSQG